MPERSFRCYCDPGASVWTDRWLRVPTPTWLPFWIFTVSSLLQALLNRDTHSPAWKWSPWSLLDILTDAYESRRPIFSSMFLSLLFQHMMLIFLDLILKPSPKGKGRDARKAVKFVPRCPRPPEGNVSCSKSVVLVIQALSVVRARTQLQLGRAGTLFHVTNHRNGGAGPRVNWTQKCF